MLSTKARTLSSLGGRLKSARIAPLSFFTVERWTADGHGETNRISSAIGQGPWIVRSSALDEDGTRESLAGRYVTVPNVGASDLPSAIERVIRSYGVPGNPDHEILVQPMLSNVRMSGVAFSHDPSTGSPYRVINYSVGGDTSAVTGGGDKTKTFVAAVGAQELPADIVKVVALLSELESFFPGQPLDVEFAFAGDPEELILLQVRPLVMGLPPLDPEIHHRLLSRIAERVCSAQKPHPFLHGRSTVFGVMPDWNPAEMIGVRPHPLALSLYRELITDAIWAYQRNNYGYRNLRSFPLLVHFAGQPYIDVRLSFNSFVPKDVEGSVADRLVDYYIDRLIQAPSLHDKIEFEIVFSCYTLDLPERLKTLPDSTFSASDRVRLGDSLRMLTNRVIDKKNGLWRTDEAKLNILTERRTQLLASGLDPVSRIYWLLEDCKRYGTLPFAGLARAGFIAVQMLRSLVSVGAFDAGDYNRFMSGLDTISSQLSRDLRTLDKGGFLARYGHLRPGTYDILSPRYDEAPDDYFGTHGGEAAQPRSRFALTLAQMRSISRLLDEHGLSADVVSLLEFLQAGIELREHAKFVFTRSLSDALSLFREWGADLGFSNEDLSFANIACIRELYAGAEDPKEMLRRSIAEGRERYRATAALWLPPIITRPADVWAFQVPDCDPNFVTQGNVTAHVARPEDKASLAGGIVFIASADPGYDWVFSHPIAGLVTAYGGVNSHMAIRASELGLPAVIGCGEPLFKRWSASRRLHIDCAGRRVDILS